MIDLFFCLDVLNDSFSDKVVCAVNVEFCFRLEVHIVGGFLDEQKQSIQLTKELLGISEHIINKTSEHCCQSDVLLYIAVKHIK